MTTGRIKTTHTIIHTARIYMSVFVFAIISTIISICHECKADEDPWKKIIEQDPYNAPLRSRRTLEAFGITPKQEDFATMKENEKEYWRNSKNHDVLFEMFQYEDNKFDAWDADFDHMYSLNWFNKMNMLKEMLHESAVLGNAKAMSKYADTFCKEEESAPALSEVKRKRLNYIYAGSKEGREASLVGKGSKKL